MKSVICVLPFVVIFSLSIARVCRAKRLYRSSEEAAEKVASSFYATFWTGLSTMLALVLMNV